MSRSRIVVACSAAISLQFEAALRLTPDDQPDPEEGAGARAVSRSDRAEPAWISPGGLERSRWAVVPMELRSQSGDDANTPSNKEFHMASPGPGDSSAHRRKPAVRMFVLLIAVIAIVLLVVLL